MGVVGENLQRLLDRIVPALEPEAVYLFGSWARGDFDEDSDYDLLVIVPDDAPKERRSAVFAHAAKAGTGIPADIVPCRRSFFEANKDQVGTLSYKASHEGVRVFGAWGRAGGMAGDGIAGFARRSRLLARSGADRHRCCLPLSTGGRKAGQGGVGLARARRAALPRYRRSRYPCSR